MEYRNVGNTGMKASVVGLGAEHLEGKPYEQVREVVHTALDQGINIMDAFMPAPEIRDFLGRALAGNRDKMMIQGHVGSIVKNGQAGRTRDLDQCRSYFDDLLRRLNTDYIDFGMMFFLDTEQEFKETFETGYAQYVQDLKRKGLIRSIGFSSHNPAVAARVVETGVVDMMMFSINLAFDMIPAEIDVLETFEDFQWDQSLGQIDPQRQRLYELCESKGVGITVMKTLGGGKLVSQEHTPFDRAMTVGQCTHYALTRPAVASALIGCRTKEEVLEAVKYPSLTAEERDYTGAVESFRNVFQGKCVYCNHCLPCPGEINIAETTKYLDIARLDPSHIPPTVAAHYKALGNTASSCIACGSCEKLCPFQVPVIENMRQAVELFGS